VPTVDVSGRPVARRAVDLDRFFRPKVVAVVGASDTPGRPNTGIWTKLRQWGERAGATVHPVNPKRDRVDGLPAYPTVLDVPDEVDVAVLVVGDPLEALEQSVAKGARFAVVFASGYAEVGADGEEAQQRLAAALAGGATRLLGPNTNLNAFEQFREDLGGPAIALISQSGHQGRPVFQAQELGIRLSHWAPTGNEADLEFADFAAWFADQDEVGVVAAYIEGFKDGRTLTLAADHCLRRGVPLVVVKVGRTDEGRSMASSHTGKLTGADAVVGGAFRQFGVTRVDGLDELIDTSALLARAKPPTTDGIVIYAISGGTGAHLADMCAGAGLRLPRLSEATQERLYEWIPRYLRVSNPVDNGGHPVGDERGRKILDALMADPDVGVLIAPITGAFPPMSDRLAQDLVDVAETTDKPVCVVWGSPSGLEPAYRDILLSSSKVAVFRTFGNAVTAVKAYLDWHGFRASYASPYDDPPLAPSVPDARRFLARGALSEHDAKQLLGAYGITIPRERLVSSADEAVRAAAEVGGVAVLKGCSPAAAHKSDLGLIRLGVQGEDAVRTAYAEISAAAERAGIGLDGLLVGEQLTGGVETIVGLVDDQLFGPTVMVGLGGVFVEVLQDVAFRVPPFGHDEARRMLLELRGYPLLTGVRGRAPVDVDALADVAVRVGRMGLDLAGDMAGDLAELDINPLLVLPRGAVALDALAVTRR
jgi:acyl-CoA synthetase (NDP forming)